MDNLDLNIQNYDVEDIFKLFKINTNKLTELELKGAYKIYLKTHPDKSGLTPDVFRFFKQAYDILTKIFYFRNTRHKASSMPVNTESVYIADEGNLSSDKLKILNKLNGISCTDFNKKFNQMFEMARVKDNEIDKGYEDWYRNYEDKETPQINLSQFGEEFEKRKRESKALVVKQDLKEMGGRGGYELDRVGQVEYSSDIFSKLQYEDLKKAHTETVVPVTREDFNKKKQFKSVDGLMNHRDKQDVAPLSLQQSKEYLNQREANNDSLNTRSVFNIIKRDEEISTANDKMWGYLQRLE